MTRQLTTRPRCIIYGTGFVGQELARLVDQKGWELVAACNRAGEKVGQDIGELAGLSRKLGVVIQDSEAADFSGLDADIAFIATTDNLEQNMPAYEQCFSAGLNVLCHGTQSYHPYWIDEALAAKIDSMAKRAGVTFTGGGIWDNSRIWSGIIATGPCIHIESMLHTSKTESARQGLYWLDMLGVGLAEKEWHRKMAPFKTKAGKLVQIPSVSVLQALGYTIAEASTDVVPIIRDYDVYNSELDKTIKAGTSLGMRFLVDVAAENGPSARTEWDARVFEDDEVEEMQWIINGVPGTEVRFLRKDSGIASASSLLNRTPDVLAAEPGIVEITKYGPLTPC